MVSAIAQKSKRQLHYRFYGLVMEFMRSLGTLEKPAADAWRASTCRRLSSSKKHLRKLVKSKSRRTRSFPLRRSAFCDDDDHGTTPHDGMKADMDCNRALHISQGKIVRQESVNIDANFEKKKKQVEIERKMYVGRPAPGQNAS